MSKINFALAALAVLFATPVLAADGQSWQVGDHSYHVYYTDLNMNTAAGRATMLARVEHAAAKLCDGNALRVDQQACVANVLDQTRRATGGHALTVAMAERNSTNLAAR